MNFLIYTHSGKCIVRPDTSLNRFGELYLPSGVKAVGAASAVYSRICKAGKAVSEKFAPRYHGQVCFGALLYPATEMDGDRAVFCPAESSCFDSTTIFTQIEAEDSFKKLVEDAIVKCSSRTSLRTGDIIVVEITPIGTVATAKEEHKHITVEYEGRKIAESEIIF